MAVVVWKRGVLTQFDSEHLVLECFIQSESEWTGQDNLMILCGSVTQRDLVCVYILCKCIFVSMWRCSNGLFFLLCSLITPVLSH